MRGALLLAKNEIASALDDFSEAIRITPGWALPQANKAESLRRQGHLPEALLAVNTALTLDPGLEYAQKVRDAIQADKRKKELKAAAGPDYGTCFNTAADYKLRGEACDRLIKIGFLTGAELSSAYVTRGWMRYKDGQSGLSIADNEEAIKHNPNNALAYGELGAFMLDNNDPVKALPYFDEAIRADPKWAHPYAGKAEALRRMGKLSDALAEVNTALSLDQNLAYGKQIRNAILASTNKSKSSRRK
jgi:tetratricopeptide (TPR) repeat protein